MRIEKKRGKEEKDRHLVVFDKRERRIPAGPRGGWERDAANPKKGEKVDFV